MLQIISGWDQGDFHTPKHKKNFRTGHFIYVRILMYKTMYLPNDEKHNYPSVVSLVEMFEDYCFETKIPKVFIPTTMIQ